MPCLKAPVHHERLILIPYPTSSHISHHFGGDPLVKLSPISAALSNSYLLTETTYLFHIFPIIPACGF